jgi:glycerol-3-phosphate dehydrogenase
MSQDVSLPRHPLAPKNAVISKNFGPADRVEDLKALKTAVYDICVVGGGITGAAIARDAALRGLKVLLVEKDDFASGTSSRSSKLVHGGVRYLEMFEFKLVFEATRERARLWKLAPHLVTPMPFVFPTFHSSRVPLWKLNLGLWLYDILSLFRSPTLHKKWNKAATLKNEPALRSQDLVGSIFYWDGATDDALLTLSNILDARETGATILNRLQVTAIHWNQDVSQRPDAFQQIELLDTSCTGQGQTHSAKARTVISATGPWTDEFLAKTKTAKKPLLAVTRGSHIVVPFDRLPSRHAIVLFHPKDGRVLFTIPWENFTVIGTTDVYSEENPDLVHVTAEETQYLVEAANSYFPACHIKTSDVVSTWSGLRPLLAPPDKASASQVSREHHIEWFDPGLLVIAGGKLTTHREMAEQAVDATIQHTLNWSKPIANHIEPSETRHRPLPRSLYPLQANEKISSHALGKTEAGRLTMADVEGICRTQMVQSLEDLFVRRTQIFYKEELNGWLLIPKLKSTLCKELGWSEEIWNLEVAAYRNYLDLNILQPLGRTLPALQ